MADRDRLIAAAARIGTSVDRTLRDPSRVPEPATASAGSFEARARSRLEDATTASFEAWRLYARGMSLHAGYLWRQSAELLERAVEVDPAFGTAHSYLARAYTSLGASERASVHYRRAFELADEVSDRERYFIHAGYFEHVTRQPELASDAYSTLLLTYPDHFWGLIYARWFHLDRGDTELVVDYTARYADARPDDVTMNIRAAFALGAWGDNPVRARPYVARAQRALLSVDADPLTISVGGAAAVGAGDLAWITLRDVYDRWLEEDIDGALRALRPVAVRAHARYAPWIGRAYFNLGRLEEAERIFAALPRDTPHHHEGLVMVALARDDREALRRHLAALVERGPAAQLGRYPASARGPDALR